MSKPGSRISLRNFARYIVLPGNISAFEDSYLRRINRIGIVFFALHVPVMVVIAWLNGTGPALALALSLAILAGPVVARATLANPRIVSVTYGIAAMFMGGLLVHVGQGPMQIEMHFYFFALIAMLAVFGNPLVILAAAVTVALHHLVLWMVLARSVFNYDAPVWVVAVHFAFVILESTAAVFVARSFFDNVIGLERIVAERTRELDARNRETRLVLDHVSEGLLTINRDGAASPERSLANDRWFGPPASGRESIFDMFARLSPDFAERSRAGWAEVIEAVMPLALTLDQMPKDLSATGCHYRIEYLPIGSGERPERFLVVMTDATAEVRREQAEIEQRETLSLFAHVVSDRPIVEQFLAEGERMLDAVSASIEDRGLMLRTLHTLKGNSGLLGLHALASLCHELETRLTESEVRNHQEFVSAMRDHWVQLSARVERLLGNRPDMIEITESDYRALEQSVRRSPGPDATLRLIHDLKNEPTQRRLEHFGEQVRRLAERLEKQVVVRVDGADLRLDPKRWGPFWSAFAHAVRNAVDHGLEGPAERSAHGKATAGVVVLRTYLRGDRFVVEIRDDGRGIDWDRVALRAAELGLTVATDADVRSALFRDGVSTATRVTELSGRGLGMGALHEATVALGGEFEVATEPARGTTLRMIFPSDSMTRVGMPNGLGPDGLLANDGRAIFQATL